jgi:hypothetical protein
MGTRQKQNFEKLIQHSMRTNKSLFPFLYTCIMHMDPNPILIEECRKFVKLAEFFGTSEAPKLEVKIVHLLFMLDFVTGLILRRFYLVHKLVMKSGNNEGYKNIDKDFQGFKNEIGGTSGQNKDKLYQPRHGSGRKSNEIEELKPTLIGFNELQDSELLQGSSLLKSINNSKNQYNTSEEVNALMDSSFLVNTLEALKRKKESEKKIQLENPNADPNKCKFIFIID